MKILGQESKMLDYLKAELATGEIFYSSDDDFAEKLECSLSSIRRYRSLLKQKKMINTKSIYNNGAKKMAYWLPKKTLKSKG